MNSSSKKNDRNGQCLSRVYALILSWPDKIQQTAASNCPGREIEAADAGEPLLLEDSK
jgi:hypothetical protein